ncbi:hypothetical protein MMC13_004907 [Lambiella insularis]|nr:hypothetical protein [Lambiella insularis]
MLFLHKLLLTIWSITISSVIYLYLYPIFHGCGFPTRDGSFDPPASIWGTLSAQIGGKEQSASARAPFRLLALGDPQLEGDTSIPNTTYGYFPTLRRLPLDLRSAQGSGERIAIFRNACLETVLREVPAKLQAWRKQVDLFGNDYYLAHIFRTLHQYTKPTHVAVLGDLLGSQWIDDEEFERRGWRFWHRVFRHGRKMEEGVTKKATQEILGEKQEWDKRIINVVGNHDVGYAGDMTVERVERFERVFGTANWEVTFILPKAFRDNETGHKIEPALRLIVLNSLNLDTPAKDRELQDRTYQTMNEVIGRSRPVEDRTSGTILLTHLPLHKDAGICVDSPSFDFYSEEDGGGLREQNHLSYDAGKGILEGIYGMSGNFEGPAKGVGRNGIILTGHDHEGCDVYHHLPPGENAQLRRWNSTRWHEAKDLRSQPIPGIREITVRSMMGDFGGNAGLLSAWFDYDAGEWQFAYSSCSIGVQHIWWAIHAMVLVTTGFSVLVYITVGFNTPGAAHGVLERGHGNKGSESSNVLPAIVAASGTEDVGKGRLRRRKS